MKKTSTATSMIIALLILASLSSVRIGAAAGGFPTADRPTLLTSLSPSDATIGDDIAWLIWTDPNCSGWTVGLEIYDSTNDTVILDGNRTLSTLNDCGSWKETVSTSGYEQHSYRFTANMTINGMKMESIRYLDLQVTAFSIWTSTSPFKSIPGDGVELDIFEGVYPYVDAIADIVVYNETHASLWSLNDVAIPAANGSRTIAIPTDDLIAGSCDVIVTASSALGNDSAHTMFLLSDIIVTIAESYYYIGDQVNVSVRTYASVAEAGITIVSMSPPAVVDDTMPLTDGQGSKLYDSGSWAPALYFATATATVGANDVEDATYFTLTAFDVDVYCDKHEYLAGEPINITISTTRPQPDALYDLTITNSTADEIWTHGPDHLGIDGTASLMFDTTGLPAGDYTIDVVVNNTHYEETGADWFEIVVPVAVFDIYANVEPYDNMDYAMPDLNVTVVPEQTHADLAIEVSSGGHPYYHFLRNNFTISTYDYLIPTVGLDDATYYVEVVVTSAAGTNSTIGYFIYSRGTDSDGDGLPDSQETSLGTSLQNPDSDTDGFFDGIEVFRGSDPLDPSSVIPEQIFSLVLTLICLTPLICLVARKKNKLFTS